MDLKYPFARLPDEPELIRSVNAAAERLFAKLKALDANGLDISDYNRVYLKAKLRNPTNCLQLFSYILSWALAGTRTPLSEFVFLEYGGGTGMLSLLAKELGIRTVIYNDIYEVSCRDAQTIGKSMQIAADHYVPGDIDQVLAFLREQKLSCRAVGSYDVIEHIYDVERFFKKVPELSSGPLTVMMGSGANDLNPMVRYQEKKKQLEVEHHDRQKTAGHKERDTLLAYVKIRQGMIENFLRSHGRALGPGQVEQLANRTRGMIEPDIQAAVKGFLDSGRMPPEPEHPTNTCDPYTGNWAEHLMDPYRLADGLAGSGFSAKVLSGYWGHMDGLIKSSVAKALNIQISLFSKQGIRLAPFYSIYGTRA